MWRAADALALWSKCSHKRLQRAAINRGRRTQSGAVAMMKREEPEGRGRGALDEELGRGERREERVESLEGVERRRRGEGGDADRGGGAPRGGAPPACASSRCALPQPAPRSAPHPAAIQPLHVTTNPSLRTLPVCSVLVLLRAASVQCFVSVLLVVA
eukprot:3933498-Rhodomonas_salina.1